MKERPRDWKSSTSVTTSGAKMENCDQKRIRFKKEGFGGISEMVQVTFVSISWVRSRASCKMCYTVAFLHQLGNVLHRHWCCCCACALLTVVDGQLRNIKDRVVAVKRPLMTCVPPVIETCLRSSNLSTTVFAENL